MTTIQQTISILAIFLAAVSCTAREDARPDTSLRDEGRLISLSREAFVKSALDGDVARWTAGDEVAVYQNEGEAPKKFIAQEDGVTARFSLKIRVSFFRPPASKWHHKQGFLKQENSVCVIFCAQAYENKKAAGI